MNNEACFLLLFSFVMFSGVQLDSRLQERQKFKNEDFVFDLGGFTPQVMGMAGTGTLLTVEELPSLKGEGVAYVLFRIDGCGINLPHVHPRATELFYVISGTFKTAFVEENGGRTIVNTVSTGQITFFPQGLLHEEQNEGCDRAFFLSAFNTEDPGVLTVSQALFSLPDDALKSTFKFSKDQINAINATLPANPAQGFNTECLARCKKATPY